MSDSTSPQPQPEAQATSADAPPSTDSTASGQAPSGLSLALLVVVLLAVGALSYVTWLYFQLEERLVDTMTELEAAEREVDALLHRTAEQELGTISADEDEDEATDGEEAEVAESSFELFYEAWEHVREAGMPQHEFLLHIDERSLWPLYREVVTQPQDTALDVETRRWFALICARLDLHERARDELARLVEEEPEEWTAWLVLAELYAEREQEDKVEQALEAAAAHAPDNDEAAQQLLGEYRERLGEPAAADE